MRTAVCGTKRCGTPCPGSDDCDPLAGNEVDRISVHASGVEDCSRQAGRRAEASMQPLTTGVPIVNRGPCIACARAVGGGGAGTRRARHRPLFVGVGSRSVFVRGRHRCDGSDGCDFEATCTGLEAIASEPMNNARVGQCRLNEHRHRISIVCTTTCGLRSSMRCSVWVNLG